MVQLSGYTSLINHAGLYLGQVLASAHILMILIEDSLFHLDHNGSPELCKYSDQQYKIVIEYVQFLLWSP